MDQREKLAYIYNHFGEEAQAKKRIEEIKELHEAIIEGNKDHIIEELADVFVLLNQVMAQHKIPQFVVLLVHNEKIDRTIERIESGYYKNAEGNTPKGTLTREIMLDRNHLEELETKAEKLEMFEWAYINKIEFIGSQYGECIRISKADLKRLEQLYKECGKHE